MFKPPKVKTKYSQAHYNQLNEANKRFTHPIGLNNRALREWCGMSINSQVLAIKDRIGYGTSPATIKGLESGDFTAFSVNYLSTLALFWGVGLTQLATVDFTNERNLPKHIRSQKKVNNFIAAFQRKRVV